MESLKLESSKCNEAPRQEDEAGVLEAGLWMPREAVGGVVGVVVLVGENGRQRMHPAGDYVAAVLREARFATLLVELPGIAGAAQMVAPTGEEELQHDRQRRLRAACDWLQRNDLTADLPLVLHGVGAGAKAVLDVAPVLGRRVCALAVRGLRTWPVAAELSQLGAPALLVAGSLDDAAVRNSRAAYAALRCRKRFEIVPGATRAFDEPGSLEVVARLLRNWFVQHVHQYA